MGRSFQLVIAYDGTNYAGWQIQPGKLTIQGMLERALARITRERVPITGSGRTDAGVHALGQVASCRLPQWRATSGDLRAAMNTHLPPDISVLQVRDAPDDFHAIRDCTGKRYRYQIQVGGVRRAFDFRYRWHVRGPLDLEAMRGAARLLEGTHDFASFQAAGSDRKTTVRTVRECVVEQRPSETGGATTDGEEYAWGDDLVVEIEADGFLYNMVRNIVGTLVEVGRGKEGVDWVSSVLLAKDRTVAGPTAPPQGLFLQRVDYVPF